LLSGVYQRRPNLCVESNFVVDGLALFGKGPLVLVLRLGEEAADQPIIEINDLIGQRCGCFDHQCDQRAVAPRLLIFFELVNRCLASFAGEL